MAPETLVPVSVDDYLRVASRFERSELVAGQVVELSPAGFRHSALAVAVAQRIREYVTAHNLGVVTGSDGGYVLSVTPPTVRAPDVGVILTPRIPSPTPRGFFPGAPDLAVEVLSPDDRPGEMAARIADFLRTGTQAVWVIDPELQTLTVHTPAGAMRYGADEVLDGVTPLPGLRMQVRRLLGT